MVDIQKDFGESFNLLIHRKKIIIPTFISILIPLLLILLFLNVSGINPLLKEISTFSKEFQEQKTDYLTDTENIGQENYSEEMVKYLQSMDSSSQNNEYNAELLLYMEQNGYDWDKYKQIINLENIILLVLFLIVGFISALYFTSMTYSIIALNIKMGEVTMSNIFRVTNRFFLKLFSLRLLLLFIVLVPTLILSGIAVSLFFLNKLLGALSVFVFILILLVYILIVGLRLFFATPAMYMEDESVPKSIKHSLKLTKGHTNQIILAFAIIYGLSIVLNNIIAQPMYSAFQGIIMEFGVVKLLLNTAILLFFLILESFVLTFENIFLFRTYTDFKELEEVVK
jgi:membrane-anchored glycerophosphoryl diester phosphodiesterase (GDPDase)